MQKPTNIPSFGFCIVPNGALALFYFLSHRPLTTTARPCRTAVTVL